mmetsp:Transcript_50331/g.75219  ORF Transcript_50331/g.75219 Transcript_50331/m.75219 type:complete len:212 (-) Transcript_50331:232-867(-)
MYKSFLVLVLCRQRIEQPIPHIPHTGEATSILRQAFINCTTRQMNIWMRFHQLLYAILRSNDRHYVYLGDSPLLQDSNNRGDGVTRRNNGIQYIGNISETLARESIVVLDRHSRDFVFVHADMMNASIRQKFQHGLCHSQSTSQNRNESHAIRQLVAMRIGLHRVGSKGRVRYFWNRNIHILGMQRRGSFVAQVIRHFPQHRAKLAWRRRF